MVDPVTVTDMYFAGRRKIIDPNAGQVAVAKNLDFSTNASYIVDFSVINQQAIVGTIVTMFVDNSSNPEEIEVSVSMTDQFFTVPALAEGYFTITANEQSTITLASVGGATDLVTTVFYNYELPSVVWYRFGAFNKDIPLKAQGAQPTGTDMNTAEYNNPVYIGGKNDDGSDTLVPIRVDSSGRLVVVGGAVGGNVFGTDAIGTPPTQPPVFVAGIDPNGDIISFALDATGKLQVDFVGSGLATEAKQDDQIDLATPGATAARTNVPAAAINTLILAANTNRKFASVFNDSTEVLYLALGTAAASITSYTVQLLPGSMYELNNYSGEVRGIWSAAVGNARVTESV